MADDRIEEALNTIHWPFVGPGDPALINANEAARRVAQLLENSIAKLLCEALDIPYETEDGHENRYPTLDEVLTDVKSRSDMWRKLLGRIEVVDPKWLDALRKGEELWEGKYPPEVQVVIAFHQPPTGNLVAEVWTKKVIPVQLLVRMLTEAAEGFLAGKATRIE